MAMITPSIDNGFSHMCGAIVLTLDALNMMALNLVWAQISMLCSWAGNKGLAQVLLYAILPIQYSSHGVLLMF
jgi:hypothetical protein